MKFPRGPGPLVSFLIPTRGRPARLREGLNMILDLTADPRAVEFVLRVDFDDAPTLWHLADPSNAVTDCLGRGASVQVLLGPRGRGWRDIYLWLTEMAKVATGDWVSVWNDDADMLTRDWDALLAAAEVPDNCQRLGEVCFLRFSVQQFPQSFSYGVWRRDGVRLLGNFGQASLADHWLYEVLSRAGTFHDFFDIMVRHQRGRMADQAWAEGGQRYTDECLAELKTPVALAGISNDAELVKAFLHGSAGLPKAWGER